MREVRYILLLLLIGLYTYEVPELAASQSSEAVRSVSFVINDLSNDYAHRMQQQYDCTDALPSYQLGTRAEENRLRTRRQERISTSWPMPHCDTKPSVSHTISIKSWLYHALRHAVYPKNIYRFHFIVFGSINSLG